MSVPYDVAIAGGGPSGAACGTLCAQAGLRTLVLERCSFPRDKVCGDCLNPGCWPLFEELGIAETVRQAAPMPIANVAFADAEGRRIAFPLHGEMALPRRVLDDLLLRRCMEAGADVRQEAGLRSLEREKAGGWRISTQAGEFAALRLVAADGRNSTVARLLGAAPGARRDRVALQAHLPTPAGLARDIELHLLPQGYCGTAPVGDGVTNFCMVSTAPEMEALKAGVARRFGFDARQQQWRAIAPLERAPIRPLRDGVLYTGDAARVVEPFTGEGIYYALLTGMLAARHIATGSVERYPADCAALYRQRLWINRMARWAVTHPGGGAMLLRLLSLHPASLGFLVQRVSAPAQS
ncbi:MAG TPA: FAD-dependent monooxygenase [Chthoniobacteraceae bacterium]|jgi:geranylgeranyl reductase family protein|nr:FAD-dependent monooxygenase [Chthoniobacteraceae bacterium]